MRNAQYRSSLIKTVLRGSLSLIRRYGPTYGRWYGVIFGRGGYYFLERGHQVQILKTQQRMTRLTALNEKVGLYPLTLLRWFIRYAYRCLDMTWGRLGFTYFQTWPINIISVWLKGANTSINIYVWMHISSLRIWIYS